MPRARQGGHVRLESVRDATNDGDAGGRCCRVVTAGSIVATTAVVPRIAKENVRCRFGRDFGKVIAPGVFLEFGHKVAVVKDNLVPFRHLLATGGFVQAQPVSQVVVTVLVLDHVPKAKTSGRQVRERIPRVVPHHNHWRLSFGLLVEQLPHPGKVAHVDQRLSQLGRRQPRLLHGSHAVKGSRIVHSALKLETAQLGKAPDQIVATARPLGAILVLSHQFNVEARFGSEELRDARVGQDGQLIAHFAAQFDNQSEFFAELRRSVVVVVDAADASRRILCCVMFLGRFVRERTPRKAHHVVLMQREH